MQSMYGAASIIDGSDITAFFPKVTLYELTVAKQVKRLAESPHLHQCYSAITEAGSDTGNVMEFSEPVLQLLVKPVGFVRMP